MIANRIAASSVTRRYASGLMQKRLIGPRRYRAHA
jgi:hypothetical protein